MALICIFIFIIVLKLNCRLNMKMMYEENFSKELKALFFFPNDIFHFCYLG